MAYTPNPSEVPLSQPLYGATMGQAINRFWKKYVVFSGRASRSEYRKASVSTSESWWYLSTTLFPTTELLCNISYPSIVEG